MRVKGGVARTHQRMHMVVCVYGRFRVSLAYCAHPAALPYITLGTVAYADQQWAPIRGIPYRSAHVGRLQSSYWLLAILGQLTRQLYHYPITYVPHCSYYTPLSVHETIRVCL